MSQPEQLQSYLQASADSLLWVIEQVPTGRLFVRPLPVFGEWSVSQILAHVTWQERHLALPYLQPGSLPEYDQAALTESHNETVRAALTGDLAELITDFQTVHAEWVALLAGYSETDWRRTITSPAWGEVMAYWVALNAYQHRLEHTDTILKMVLFWDIELSAQGLIKD